MMINIKLVIILYMNIYIYNLNIIKKRGKK